MTKRGILTSVAACSLVFAAMGCGGGNGHVRLAPAPEGELNFAGSEVVSDTATSTAVVPPVGGTTVSTAQSGDVVVPSGVAPADSTVTPNTPLAVLPMNTGFFGTFPAGSQLSVNGNSNSGAQIGSDGLLNQNVGLPVSETGTSYTLGFPGGDLQTRVLTVEEMQFEGKFYFRNGRIISPVPYSITGRIPNNGENAGGSIVTCRFGPGNNGRQATLFVDYGTGFTLQRTVTIYDNHATEFNLQEDAQNVPATGVRLVRFTIGDL